jgi:DNA-binding MarR family transcriptional regulator
LVEYLTLQCTWRKDNTSKIKEAVVVKMSLSNKIQNDIKKARQLKAIDPDINLAIRFDQTNALMATAIELELKHFKTNQTQVRVLTMLSRENRPVTIDELASWCLKSFNSVSTLVNRMEKKGLIKKIKMDGDLKTYVILADKGSILYHLQVTENSIRVILSKLSAEEKKDFEAILKKISENTRDVLGLDFKPSFLP